MAACAPSPQAIQTAIGQTQEANPTSTFTPIPPIETPTHPPTETPTIIPSPTLDLLLIQYNLKGFLLQMSDFPQGGSYSSYVMERNSLSIIPNDKVTIDNSVAYIKETGRIEGWSVDYGIYNNGWKEYIEDKVNLYQTTAGAQLALSNYSNAVVNKIPKEINPPEIGDFTRSYYNDWGLYEIDFAYRNCTHELWGYGAENEIIDLRNIAQSLITRLQTSPLLNP
jgi:hypothetical protein